MKQERSAELGEALRQDLCLFLKEELKRQKISLRDLSQRMSPTMSAQNLHYILTGKRSVCISQVYQFARILGLSLEELLDRVHQRDRSHAMIFNAEQEIFITQNPLHYKVAVAFSFPRRVSDVQNIFSEDSTEIARICTDLKKLGVIVPDGQERFRIHKDRGLFSLSYKIENNPVELSIVRDTYDNVVQIFLDKPELIPYIQGVFAMDYLTPEQSREIREHYKEGAAKVRRFFAENRRNKTLWKLSKDNLYCVFSVVGPISLKSFFKLHSKTNTPDD